MDRRLLVDALGAGAATGLVAEALVLRMNPEVVQTVRGVLIGMPLWASWGMLLAGVPLLIGLVVLERLRPRSDRWAAPELFALVFAVAAILSMVNAKLHTRLLERTAHRVLLQDAVAWSVAVLLALIGGAVVRRLGGGRRARIVFSVVMLILPMTRMTWAPTPLGQYLEVAARPLGEPARPLLVIGLEGLDAKVLHADTASSRYRGVKEHRAWDLPMVFPETLRLLPWTPEGSRMILPWGLAEQTPPPPTTVAPLWARLRASDVTTLVFGWPGSWGDDPALVPATELEAGAVLEASMGASLEPVTGGCGARGAGGRHGRCLDPPRNPGVCA